MLSLRESRFSCSVFSPYILVTKTSKIVEKLHMFCLNFRLTVTTGHNTAPLRRLGCVSPCVLFALQCFASRTALTASLGVTVRDICTRQKTSFFAQGTPSVSTLLLIFSFAVRTVSSHQTPCIYLSAWPLYLHSTLELTLFRWLFVYRGCLGVILNPCAFFLLVHYRILVQPRARLCTRYHPQCLSSCRIDFFLITSCDLDFIAVSLFSLWEYFTRPHSCQRFTAFFPSDQAFLRCISLFWPIYAWNCFPRPFQNCHTARRHKTVTPPPSAFFLFWA
jgi:hypothetical protein